MSALCVECDSDLNIFGRVRLGQRIICPNCGVTLEVISTHPIEVDVAYDEGEELGAADRFTLDEEDFDESEGFDAYADEIDEDELIAYGRLDGEGEEDLIDEDNLEDAKRGMNLARYPSPAATHRVEEEIKRSRFITTLGYHGFGGCSPGVHRRLSAANSPTQRTIVGHMSSARQAAPAKSA